MTEWFKTISLLFFSTSIRVKNSDVHDKTLQELAASIDNGKPDAEKLLRDYNKKLCDEINTELEEIDKRKKNALRQAKVELIQRNPENN